MMSPLCTTPSTTLTLVITPLYESNILSNINALVGLLISPLGLGIFSIISSSNLSTPSPVLPLVSIISSFVKPNTSFSSSILLSISLLFILKYLKNIIQKSSSLRYNYIA